MNNTQEEETDSVYPPHASCVFAVFIDVKQNLWFALFSFPLSAKMGLFSNI